jgi:hypothetical protein
MEVTLKMLRPLQSAAHMHSVTSSLVVLFGLVRLNMVQSNLFSPSPSHSLAQNAQTKV